MLPLISSASSNARRRLDMDMDIPIDRRGAALSGATQPVTYSILASWPTAPHAAIFPSVPSPNSCSNVVFTDSSSLIQRWTIRWVYLHMVSSFPKKIATFWLYMKVFFISNELASWVKVILFSDKQVWSEDVMSERLGLVNLQVAVDEVGHHALWGIRFTCQREISNVLHI